MSWPIPPVRCTWSAQVQAAMWSHPPGERRPARKPPPAEAAVWPHPSLPLSKAEWPARATASAACPATSGLPETRLRSRTLQWTKPC